MRFDTRSRNRRCRGYIWCADEIAEEEAGDDLAAGSTGSLIRSRARFTVVNIVLDAACNTQRGQGLSLFVGSGVQGAEAR